MQQPTFPFNTTQNGILFTALVAFVLGTAQALITSAVSRRRARKDDDAATRRAIAQKLRAAVSDIEGALSDQTSGHRNALRSACDTFRDVANIDLGGHGTERLQDRATEFVNGLLALDQQMGPVGP